MATGRRDDALTALYTPERPLTAHDRRARVAADDGQE